jgi:hypothetical protein
MHRLSESSPHLSRSFGSWHNFGGSKFGRWYCDLFRLFPSDVYRTQVKVAKQHRKCGEGGRPPYSSEVTYI